MSQTVPAAEKSAARSAKQPLVPPDERFWQRYSPHGELPLSGASSLALHLLIFGLMLLSAWLAYAVFSHTNRSLPVEAVRLGGGGGNPQGTGNGPNQGKLQEAGGDKTEDGAVKPDPVDTPERPKLEVKPTAPKPIDFDVEALRQIQQTDTTSSRAMQRLADQQIRIQLPDRQPSGRGDGGTGSDGGSGDGRGIGTGDRRGEGSSGRLTQREERMLRWSLLFNTADARDYLSQLQGLGAILAIPVDTNANANDAPGKKYKIIPDLSVRPAKLVDQDVRRLHRIYWADNNPASVRDVMALLGVPLQPRYFVAFMPEDLEQKLYEMEKEYLKKHYSGRAEKDIIETRFRIKRSGKGYEPEMREEHGGDRRAINGSAMKVRR